MLALRRVIMLILLLELWWSLIIVIHILLLLLWEIVRDVLRVHVHRLRRVPEHLAGVSLVWVRTVAHVNIVANVKSLGSS